MNHLKTTPGIWFRLKANLFALLVLALYTCSNIIQRLRNTRKKDRDSVEKPLNTFTSRSTALKNASNIMRLHYLQHPPTENEIRREEAAFETIARHYKETLHMITLKREGKYCMGYTLVELENHAEQLRLDAFHKIPTRYLVELDELLTQTKIQWT